MEAQVSLEWQEYAWKQLVTKKNRAKRYFPTEINSNLAR